MKDDYYYMKIALDMAKKAYELDEVPVGCIIVSNDEVIASSYNRKELDGIATYHAEMLAINEACKKLNTWHLDNCVMYTTMEPCMMCTGAILQARISRVVYGTRNYSFGYLSKLDNNKINVTGNILEDECVKLLKNFFKNKRNLKDYEV